MTNGFEVFERAGGNSVHSRGFPAISFTRKAFVFNRLALEALGCGVGDEVAIQFHRGSGLIAFEKPGKGYAPSQSGKLGKSSGKTAGAQLGFGQFLSWAGIDKKAKAPFQIYRLGFDEQNDLHMIRLPRGSWEKPVHAEDDADVVLANESGRSVPSAVKERLNAARDKAKAGQGPDGRPTAQRRRDLPAASPHRVG